MHGETDADGSADAAAGEDASTTGDDRARGVDPGGVDPDYWRARRPDPDRLGFHSLTRERSARLPVRGDLPDWLSGSLVRNGPGAFRYRGASVDHWFDGLAMVHRFRFPGDGSVHYRNRFLRSEAFDRARRGSFDGGFATGGAGVAGRLAALALREPYDNANVVVERIGGRYLALTESPRRVVIDPRTLETVGHAYDGGEKVGDLTCAHVRHDPETGAVVNVETAFGRQNRYHVYEVDPAGRWETIATVPVERPAYMHSFGLTPNYVVLTAFPFTVDPVELLTSAESFVDAFEWRPEEGTRFIVVDRSTGEVVDDPAGPALFGFHHVNAYETRDSGGSEESEESEESRGTDGARGPDEAESDPTLVVDLETVPDPEGLETLYLESLRSGDLDVLAGRIERFRLDLSGGVDRETLYDDGTALPTVSPDRWCRRHRYVYAQSTDQPMHEWPRRVLKLDVETGDVREFGGDAHYGEPIFVPGPGDREDDGVLLTVALDRDRRRSELVVLDAREMTERARAPLPHAVPFDFHGRFFPELD